MREKTQKLALRKNRRGEPGFVKFPVALFPYRGLSEDEKLMWMLLIDRQGNKDDTRYGQTSLGDFLGWSRFKAGRVIRQLHRKLWIAMDPLPERNFRINARPGWIILRTWVADLEKKQQAEIREISTSGKMVRELSESEFQAKFRSL